MLVFRAAVCIVAIAVLSACGAPGPLSGLGERSAIDIAVQSSDVSGLQRCPQSGKPDEVVKAIRDAGDIQSADDLANRWQDANSNGGQDGYVVGYAASVADCVPYVFNSHEMSLPSGKIVFSFVVVFSSSTQAQAAWNAGTFGGTPSQFKSFGGTVGNGTGLGDNSATIEFSGTWSAIWAKGSACAMLQTSYGPDTATQLAKTVSGRM